MTDQPNPDLDDEARESGAMQILDADACWSLLASADVGRLAMSAAGEIDIFPVNFVVHDRSVIFRTAPGTKLVEVAMGGAVAFEADGYDPETGRAWSVVCKGTARRLDHFDEIYQAQDLPLFPWNNAPKEEFVRISPTEVTGRRFTATRR